MSRLAFTDGRSTSSRNLAMLATSFKSESANGSSSSAISRPSSAAMFAEGLHVLDGGSPLLFGGDHFLLPDIFTQDEQDVFGLEEERHVEVGAHAIEVKSLDAGVEVDESDGDASDAHDRQAGFAALGHDQFFLVDVDIERVGEDVDRIEADFLGLPDSEVGSAAGLDPGRVDEPELHDAFSVSTDCGRRPTARWSGDAARDRARKGAGR